MGIESLDPIAVTTISLALVEGLKLVGKGLLEEGAPDLLLEPIKQPLQRLIVRGPHQRAQEKAMLGAVKAALQIAGAPADADGFERYVLNLGFDQLQARDNKALRREIARAALMMTEPDPSLISNELLRQLNWPTSRRPELANFLSALHQELASLEDWNALIQAADQAQVRRYLRGMTTSLSHVEAYARDQMALRGLDPDKPETQALEEYVNHLLVSHSRLSFLFIKPAGRPGQARSEAELEAVFVPLEVEDPEARFSQEARQTKDAGSGDRSEDDRPRTMNINEVLERYPVFLLKGLPGSGKTTLLRHLTTCFAGGQAGANLSWTAQPLLPIFVPLRNFGRYLDTHKREYTSPAPSALRRFIEDYFAEYELEFTPGFFHDRLKEGHCLVLLDGLDEVADRDQRAMVAQMVSAFIKHYAPLGNRFGLASRPKGYDEVAEYLPRPVVCTVQPLEPESRDDLVRNLLKILEPDAQRRQSQISDLLADIRRKEKVDELSRNPLFCTTLVLVYKYRGTTLPERRVDVYKELVELLLGFWDTHRAEREGVAGVRELVLVDGTGRAFLDEGQAVEAKQRALVHVADWMQDNGLSETTQQDVENKLAQFFSENEGAQINEKAAWARNFLSVAHQRSGLFIEVQPGVFAFSHQSFREYLAATALIEDLDPEMAQTALDHATDPWWDEVILLAAAHPMLSPKRREFLLQKMLDAGHIVLAGRCAVDAGARLPAPMRERVMGLLHQHMTEERRDPKERYAAGEALDELGWLPDDLNAWLPCPKCADGGGDLLAMRYPVTNAGFERFIAAGGYENSDWWDGRDSPGWKWRETPPGYRGEGAVKEPEYWRQARFGRERRGYPVVGVSWYEASAYAAWLADVLRRARAGEAGLPDEERALVADLPARDVTQIRLPTEDEWRRMAGGTADKNRYPWDAPKGPATADEAAIAARCNVSASGVGGTSAVGMYPLGESIPNHLMDMGGNVWEWTNSWYDKEDSVRVLVGGSWYHGTGHARCASRYRDFPNYSHFNFGFRLVSPIVSGS